MGVKFSNLKRDGKQGNYDYYSVCSFLLLLLLSLGRLIGGLLLIIADDWPDLLMIDVISDSDELIKSSTKCRTVTLLGRWRLHINYLRLLASCIFSRCNRLLLRLLDDILHARLRLHIDNLRLLLHGLLLRLCRILCWIAEAGLTGSFLFLF